jgi:hypothetical protein
MQMINVTEAKEKKSENGDIQKTGFQNWFCHS